MRMIRRTIACAVGLLAFAGFAHAVPQMLLPAAANKAAKVPPGDVKSGAAAVAFNAAELHAMKIGEEVELTLPNGTRHAFVFDQKIAHPDGNVTWIGYYRDRDLRLKLNAVITTGPDGSLGTIETPDGDFALRLDRSGGEWLVDAKAEKALANPIRLKNDAHFVPESKLKSAPVQPLAQPEFGEVVAGVTQPFSSTVPMTDVVTKAGSPAIVDMLVVYNDSLAAGVGNTTTWANNLIAQANTQFTNSLVNVQLRLAGTMLYSYADGQNDSTVLYDISGVDPTTFADTNSAAHTAFENKRAAVGADMVTFYRGGNGSTDGGSNFGSGVAWTAQAAVTSSWARYTYSTVVGCWSTCQFIWTHEVGHNMGNMHDRATAAWEAGDPVNYGHGSTPDSFGFYTCNGSVAGTALTCNPFTSPGGCTTAEPHCSSPTNAFHDLMAYFHADPGLVKQFSNPNLTCATSGLACGIAAGTTEAVTGRPISADTVSSMNANAVALSALRSPAAGSTTASLALASNANPVRVGMPVTFTATATSSSGTPTGTVAFTLNGVTFAGCGAVALSGAGTATCTTTLGNPGTFTIASQLTGSGAFGNATANAITQYSVPVPSLVGTPPKKQDFNLDSKADLAWKGPGGAFGVWLMNGTGTPTAAGLAGPANATMRAIGDFNGDGRADILWRAADGSYSISLMNGTSITSTTTILGAGLGWDVIGVGDFDGDGKSDLLWNSADGQFGVWLMNGATVTTAAGLTPPAPGYVPMFVADVSGDLKADILWGAADGSMTVVLMNGVTPGAKATPLGPNTGWRPTHVADLNNDGKADILFLANDGTVGGWLMNGTTPSAAATLITAGSGWTVAATADLNGDGNADIIYRHTSGLVGAWLMNGLSVTTAAGLLNTPNTGWSIVGAGDFNFDGKADLLWRHTDGSYAQWQMNGLSVLGTASLLGPATGWELAP